jgi:hypothetical protein
LQSNIPEFRLAFKNAQQQREETVKSGHFAG